MKNNREIVSALHWARFYVGEVYVEPCLFDYLTDVEIRNAILENWASLYIGTSDREVLVSDHFTDGDIELRVRTWVPSLFTEVYPLG